MSTSNDVPAPECERMRAVKVRSQAIGDFLKWVRNAKGWMLCGESEDEYGHERLVPAAYVLEMLLAEYFHIDLDKVEAEKRAMLAHLRSKQ